ncbi:class I SAM-dependent methyltransferase [Thermococcus sp. MV11]|uniref:class I SAM-dependent methyltransferase n=1 Tax=Thermococcus sp. MV11 TaxID=1638267 RepID=UPI00142F8547|nr:class I SAM-dependent methyltransferase [Thermococcus sp. MV11]NJE03264.1 class I SAM-dependent methyltransferase [Thermococcus sp. MV11]
MGRMNPEMEAAHIVFEREYWWFKSRRELIKSLLLKFHFRGPLLDVGSGTGENLEVIKDIIPHSIGVELSDTMIKYASRLKRNVIYGNAESLPFEDSSFMSAMALDILEHVDDRRAIREIWRVLKPGGKLLVTVPAFMWLWSAHDSVHGHKRRYSTIQISNLIKEAGFNVIFLSYWNFVLFIPAAIQKKLGRSHSLVHLPKLLNNALYSLSTIDNQLIIRGKRLPIGTSIVVIAQKPIKSEETCHEVPTDICDNSRT